MSNMKLMRTGKVREETDRKGVKRQIVETKYVDLSVCKECKKEPRRPGSAYGEKCAAAFHQKKANDARLQKKIADQTKTS